MDHGRVSKKRGINEANNEDGSNSDATSTAQGPTGPDKKYMTVDRSPTPGRIINPRAVNEECVKPNPSRGDLDKWPASIDKDYSNRSYIHMDSHYQFHDDPDAPQGPPNKKGRRNNPERAKWEEEQPMIEPHHTFHALHLCYSRVKNGPPPYDRCGFQLDYDKEERKAKGFEAHYKIDALKDRVSKHLGILWHEIELEHFEKWEKQGFHKGKKGEYQNFTPEYKQWMTDFLGGVLASWDE
ncbi:hypothetical protein K458DRAFT_436482 [Lentithecium fluviatile CBS 122367]|uniref:Uncharacterized protein n=1 Tax=Lentithecium fluviatile CBS 122367 TaxID=1168545 RepID=A0A6G1IHN4_9PLEO|nr:hypothetical protein K458DRAFT_436482 [Lentithecium fluviatile CBS 122367]